MLPEAVSFLGLKSYSWDMTLPDYRKQCPNSYLAMVGHWHGDGADSRIRALHYDVASVMPNFPEAVTLEYLTHLASREDAKFTHSPP